MSGWFRIAKELHDNGVSAICVFDGENRNSAKAREACSKFLFEKMILKLRNMIIKTQRLSDDVNYVVLQLHEDPLKATASND